MTGPNEKYNSSSVTLLKLLLLTALIFIPRRTALLRTYIYLLFISLIVIILIGVIWNPNTVLISFLSEQLKCQLSFYRKIFHKIYFSHFICLLTTVFLHIKNICLVHVIALDSIIFFSF